VLATGKTPDRDVGGLRGPQCVDAVVVEIGRYGGSPSSSFKPDVDTTGTSEQTDHVGFSPAARIEIGHGHPCI
jgi:hypothetical protein